jgi:hypothetical protein
MNTISIKDPQSNDEIRIEISAEEHNHQPAWRVKFKDGKSNVVGLDQHRIWRQLDGNQLDSGLVNSIGQAIDAQSDYSS